MRHPETSKLIKEALNSPVGSTSRAKVQKVFNIMNKLHSSHDGMGGPGMVNIQSMYSTPDSPMTRPQSTPRSVVIFNKIPTPKINYGGNSARIKHDGAGGPGYYDGKGGLFDDLGGMFKTFAEPFTNYLSSSTPKTTISSTPAPNMSTVNGPVYAPPPSSTPNMSTYYPSLSSTNMSVAPKPTAPAPEPNYYPGIKDLRPSDYWSGIKSLVSPVVNYVAKPVVGAIGSLGTVLGDAALGVAGLAEYGYDTAKNAFMGGTASILPQKGDNYFWNQMVSPTAPMSWGLSAYTNNNQQIAPPTPPSVTSTTTPGAVYPSLNTGVTTTTPSGAAPSFYSTLSGRTTTPGVPGSTTSSPYGASSAFSGGASTGYSGGASGSFIDRLIATESGGDYGAVGPVLASGENAGYAALGKYQIMPNLHFGSIGLDANNEADVKKFLSTPELQDSLFSKIIGDLSTKYGGDEAKVAAAYFGGDRAAQAYGTPAGDVIGDGNLSVNQYVNKLLGKTGASGSTPGSYSSLQAAAKAAVAGGASSPTTFALEQMLDPNNPMTKGMLYSEAVEANRKSVWDKFKLDASKTAIEALQKEVTALPKDMTDYISARDQYIKQTDKAIDDYTEQMKNMDMSNPVVVQQATSHLNYLYTLRGRQNQSYMGYLNDAVVNHETKLNNAIDDYNSKLAIAESELTSTNEMTREKYNLYSQSLTELYQAVQDAPVRALQLQALQNQALGAAGTGATDQAAFDDKVGYFKQLKKLEDAHFVDKDGRAVLGTNLVDQIARTMQGDPSIEQTHMIRAYEEGVLRYLSTPPEKDSLTGTGVTNEGKRQIAEEAIRNFAQLAAVGIQSGNDAAVNQGVQSAISIGSTLSNNVGQNIVSVAPQIMEAVKTLAPGGWFFGMGTGQSPSLEQFVATVKKSTGDNSLSDSIARAVYAVFLRYSQEPGSTPKGAVTAMLNNVVGTSDRAAMTPYTPQEFANIIGRMYAEDVIMSEFGIEPQISQIMQTSLYQ